MLFGAAIVASRMVARYLGWSAIAADVFSVATGIDVGCNGLASGLQDTLRIAFPVVVLAFVFGVLAT